MHERFASWWPKSKFHFLESSFYFWNVLHWTQVHFAFPNESGKGKNLTSYFLCVVVFKSCDPSFLSLCCVDFQISNLSRSAFLEREIFFVGVNFFPTFCNTSLVVGKRMFWFCRKFLQCVVWGPKDVPNILEYATFAGVWFIVQARVLWLEQKQERVNYTLRVQYSSTPKVQEEKVRQKKDIIAELALFCIPSRDRDTDIGTKTSIQFSQGRIQNFDYFSESLDQKVRILGLCFFFRQKSIVILKKEMLHLGGRVPSFISSTASSTPQLSCEEQNLSWWDWRVSFSNPNDVTLIWVSAQRCKHSVKKSVGFENILPSCKSPILQIDD